MHKTSTAVQRTGNRPSCNVEQTRGKLSSDNPPSRQHVYRLFHRGDLEGYFLGAGRGLRIYIDSIEDFLSKNSGEAMLAAEE